MTTPILIFATAQGELAALLGISVEEVRTRKKTLGEGTDWRREGNRVLFSEAGVQKMRAALSVETPVPIGDLRSEISEPAAQGDLLVPKKTAGCEAAPANTRRVFELPDAPPVPTPVQELEWLEAWHCPANPRILEAIRPDAARGQRPPEVFRVQVRTNVNFTRGMPVAVRFVQAPDLFEFAGNRLPRHRGKY